MARAKNRMLTVYKNPNFGVSPAEVLLAQRHFEKEQAPPVGVNKEEHTETYNVPVDLLDLSTPGLKHDDIERIEAVYDTTRKSKA